MCGLGLLEINKKDDDDAVGFVKADNLVSYLFLWLFIFYVN